MELPQQMYEDLKTILPDLKSALEQGVSYGGELAHRFIAYDIAMQIISIALSGLSLAISIPLFIYATKHAEWSQYGDIPLNGWAAISFTRYILLPLLTILFIVFTIDGTCIIIKDIYIPEIRIIEVIHNIINPTT